MKRSNRNFSIAIVTIAAVGISLGYSAQAQSQAAKTLQTVSPTSAAQTPGGTTPVRALPTNTAATTASGPRTTSTATATSASAAKNQATTGGALPNTQPTGNNPNSARPAQAPANATVALPPATDSPVESILSEDLIRALRDPFQLPSILLSRKESPKTDLETYQLKDFHLNGVITGPKKTRAMLTAPGNKVYFVRIGDKIGVRDGTITQILPDAIKVIEYFTDEHGKRIPDPYEMMMSGELVSLNKKEE